MYQFLALSHLLKSHLLRTPAVEYFAILFVIFGPLQIPS